MSDKSIFWHHHINQWRSSGFTQKAYCQAHQLSYANFGYWLKRFRARTSMDDLQLVPVQINPTITTQSNIYLQLSVCRIELPIYTDTTYVRDLVEALS